jgi:hypothetical protein
MNLTQKISQMTPKGADLDATDLIEVSTIVGGSYVTKSITGQELIDAIPLPPTGLTVGTTPIASGTIGRVLFQGTGNVLQQSSSLFWDSTNNRLGIGTSSPSVDVDIVKTIDSTFEGLNVRNLSTGTNATTVIRVKDNAGNICEFGLGGTNHTSLPNIGYFYTNKQILAFYANASERMRLSPNGNVLINTTTDAGFRLDVNGTARLNNSVTAQTVSGINVLDVGNVRIADDPNGRYIQAVNTLIIRSTNNASALLVSSVTTNSWDASQLIRIRPQSGNGGIQFSTTSTSSPSNSIMTFLRQRNDGAKLAIINSEDFAASGQLPVNLFIHAGRETVSNNQANLILCHDGTSSRGNLLINTTTDAGFRLDVNGTARVSGQLTVGSSGALGNISTGSSQGLDLRVPYLVDFTFGATRTHRIAINQFGLNSFFGNNIAFGFDPSGASPASAKIELGAGTATAGTAPLKLRAGTNLTTPENGAFEYDGTNLYFTVGGVRKTVTLV